MIELARRAQYTVAFLRMAAIEIRRIAEETPDIAVELRHMARQLEAEANDLRSGAVRSSSPDNHLSTKRPS
jgi:hypothetical protein